MGMKKFVRRSFEKIRRTSSFSSISSSSSFASYSDDGNYTDGSFEGSKSSFEGSEKKRTRRTFRWRGSKTKNYQSQNKKEDKKNKSSNRNYDGTGHSTENRNEETANTRKERSLPPVSPTASFELHEAVRYFEISDREELTREFIKKKYKRLSLTHHPDRNGNDESSIQEMQKINHYFEVLEEELDRLEQQQGVSLVSPSSNSSCFTDNSKETDNREEGKDTETGKRTSFGRRKWKRRSSTESRDHKTQDTREKRNSERESEEGWSDGGTGDSQKKQRRFKRKNKRRSSVRDQVEAAWERDRAHDIYTRQVQAYRDEVESMLKVGLLFRRQPPNRPKHPLMECCDEETVVAMRLGKNRIAITIVNKEIFRATEKWTRSKARTPMDKRYQKLILRVLTRPLDEEGNTLLHYAVYTESLEMIEHLTDVARQHNAFAKFMVCTNDRNLTACDYVQGCTWDNITVPKLVATLTNEALDLLEGKDNSKNSSPQRTKESHKYRTLAADSLLDVLLGFLVGRYVAGSGWLASMTIIALAYFAEAGEGAPSGTTATQRTKPARLSKALFFALHTGWYLLVGVLSSFQHLLEALSNQIPVPWQLKLAAVAALVPFLADPNHQKSLRNVANAITETESALIHGFDWILSRARTHGWVVSSNIKGSAQLQTAADFLLLSVVFFAGQQVCGPVWTFP